MSRGVIDLDELRRLVDEYIASLPENEGDEWYGPYRSFATNVMIGCPIGGLDGQLPSFLEWLEKRVGDGANAR